MDLSEAKSTITESGVTTSSDLDKALDVVLEASRKTEDRNTCSNDETLFRSLLQFYAVAKPGVNDTRTVRLMRCIGNLSADNDHNRSLVVEDKTCINRLGQTIEFENQDQEALDSGAIAIKVLFNICNEYTPAQQASVELDIHLALIRYISKRPWHDNYDLLELSIDFLTSLIITKQGMPNSEDTYDATLVEELLQLPVIEQLDNDNFFSAASIVEAYLVRPKFQAEVLANRKVGVVFQILEKIDFNSLSLGDNQARELEQSYVKSLSEISTMPGFTQAHAVTDSFVQTLCDRCVLTENTVDSVSVAVCACVLLGNLGISDDVAIELPQRIKLDSLFNFICLIAYGRHHSSNNEQGHAEYLHAAAGLLRHLAMPLSNRRKYFASVECRQAAMALVQYQHDDVRLAGLRLYRQILSDEPHRLEWFIKSNYLTTCLRAFADTDKFALKIEVARLELAHLKTLARIAQGQPDSPLLPAFLDTDGYLDPLVFAAKQTEVPIAQSEGWLALCLFARLPQGAARIAEVLARDSALFAALREEIIFSAPTEDEESQGSDERAMSPGRRNSVPQWLRAKERDNAVVLIHALLRSHDVSQTAKDDVQKILTEANIQVDV